MTRNLTKLPLAATAQWLRIRRSLTLVDDVVSLDRMSVFAVSKDRPVLLTALAFSQILLTLDREDFAGRLGRRFYGLPILTPAELLTAERSAGRLN